MKKHRKKLIITAIFGVLLLWFLWDHFFPTRIPASNPTPGGKLETEVRLPSRLDKLMEIGNYLDAGNVDIKFYGTVVDEDGNPLSGVEVRYSAEKASIKPKSTRGTVHTDENGNFDIDTSGMTFEVNGLVKKGYLQPRLLAVYGYQGTPFLYKPDKNRREQFVMLKEDVRQVITENYIDIPLRWDGVPVTVNVATGKAAPAGELRLKITANRQLPDDREPSKKPYWRYIFEVDDGGFQAPPKTASVGIAPKEGYVSPYMVDDSTPKGHNYPELYFKHKGLYGRFLLYPDSGEKVGDRGLSIQIYRNTSGGRLTDQARR